MDFLNKDYKKFLYYLLANFAAGFFLDFGSSIYSYFIHTPIQLPDLSDISIMLWVIATTFILFRLFNISIGKKHILFLYPLLFLIIFGSGIYLPSNAVQLKLWVLGYNDDLYKGITHAAIHPNLIPVFKLIYLFDETISHIFVFLGYFSFFLLVYYFSLKPTVKNYLGSKFPLLNVLTVILNALYLAFLVVEGQSSLFFIAFFVILILIKLYGSWNKLSPDWYGKWIEMLFVMTLLLVFIWDSALQFFHVPQFFETTTRLLNIA